MTTDLIIASVFFILGLIPAYYFYKKSIRAKEPVYSIKSNNLVSGSTSTLVNLRVSYKKHQVQNLTVSKVLFYNRGMETINRQDIETINRVGISSEICDILDGSVLQVNNPANNLAVWFDPGSKNVFLDFDYLDNNHGAVIQVIHTGTKSDDICVSGDIKGIQKFIRVSENKLQPTNLRAAIREIAVRTIFIVPSLALLNAAGMLDNTNKTWVIVFALMLLFFFEGIPLFVKMKRGRELPRGLEKFNE